MRAYIVTGFLALVIAAGFEGCGSCRKKTDEPPPESPAAPATPEVAPAPPPGPPPARLPLPPPPESTTTGKTWFIADVLSRPASFWNLSVRQHVVVRARTGRMLEVPKEISNPFEFPPVTLAALDLTDRGKRGAFFDEVVHTLYERLLEQKVFTAAAPVVVFWDVRTFGLRWSVAVPVMDDAQVKPPLRLVRMPATRVHAVRLAFTEAQKFLGAPPPASDGPRTVFDLSRTAITNLRKQMSLTVQPSSVVIRLPHLLVGPTAPESVFEVLFVEERPASGAETPTPATATPSSP